MASNMAGIIDRLGMVWRGLVGAVLVLAVSGCGVPGKRPVPRGADAPCAEQAGYGFPVLGGALQDGFFVCWPGVYAAEFDPVSKTPLWVSEAVTVNTLTPSTGQPTPDFRADPELPSTVGPTPGDYANKLGLVPGLMATPRDYTSSQVRMSITFHLSNAVPQDKHNVVGIWARLEKSIDSWTMRSGGLYVVSGPIYPQGHVSGWIGHGPQSFGYLHTRYSKAADPTRGKVAVPAYLYKVILDARNGQAIAFVIPNQAIDPRLLGHYAVTVAQAQAITGITFFPDFPEPERTRIFGEVTPDWWPLR